jgi:hypothetical protein
VKKIEKNKMETLAWIFLGTIVFILIFIIFIPIVEKKLQKSADECKYKSTMNMHPIEFYIHSRASRDGRFTIIRDSHVSFLINLVEDDCMENIWKIPYEFIHNIVEGAFHDKEFIQRFLNKDIVHNILMRYIKEHP